MGEIHVCVTRDDVAVPVDEAKVALAIRGKNDLRQAFRQCSDLDCRRLQVGCL